MNISEREIQKLRKDAKKLYNMIEKQRELTKKIRTLRETAQKKWNYINIDENNIPNEETRKEVLELMEFFNNSIY